MAKVSLHLEIIVINMGCKFIAALLGLLLLACSSIHAAYTNIEEGTIHAENTLPLEYPAASSVDELIRQSSGEHNEMVSRKFLRSAVRRGLTESKKAEEFEAKRIKSDDSLHVLLDRDLASKGRAGIANDHHELLLSGTQASIRTPISALQVVNAGSGEHQSELQITGKKGRVKSLLSNLYHNLHKRISLLEVLKKQIISDTMANNPSVVDSNKHIPASSVSLQVSQPFSDPYTTSESPTPDNTTDITDMDYTPARKNPPIHNKSAP